MSRTIKYMKNTIRLAKNEFISSSGKTEQYLEFHRTFKREIKRTLIPYVTNIKVHEPNHFDVNGFMTLTNGQVLYFSIGDLRFAKKQMLIRTAKDYNDYKGGTNNMIDIDDNFEVNLIRTIKRFIR